MLEDVGSRDTEFIKAVKSIQSDLLRLAGVTKEEGYESVIIQGSGTFGIESVLSSAVSNTGKLLILSNGAYGERMIRIAEIHRIPHDVIRFDEDEITDPEKVKSHLKLKSGYTHLACVHSETTTGLFNPIDAIGGTCAAFNIRFIVDAMSSFGGVTMTMHSANIDFLVSSSNKCIEGVPGFSFAICNKTALEACKGQARTLTLDLYAQWLGLETNGQFRFTPPTLSIMAFSQAIVELDKEGGVPARENRYKKNKEVLDKGMQQLGFQYYLDTSIQGHIITSFLYPDDSAFHFERFYKKLSDRGFVIYPGKLSKRDAFRIGNIGQIFPEDVSRLVDAIREVLNEEGIKLR
jgi:2-aminoethylphosphonate-pyruvate transaminase